MVLVDFQTLNDGPGISESTGYSDKPVARAIKIKHAGFNLSLVQGEKPQASSGKLDKPQAVLYRIIKEKKNYENK
jgi:hypothetical protein